MHGVVNRKMGIMKHVDKREVGISDVVVENVSVNLHWPDCVKHTDESQHANHYYRSVVGMVVVVDAVGLVLKQMALAQAVKVVLRFHVVVQQSGKVRNAEKHQVFTVYVV